MTAAHLGTLGAELRGRVAFDVPLARYTTYRIGGPAAALASPDGVEDVVRILRFARDTGTPWLVLGLGSNVLVADRGFDGVVLRLGKGLARMRRSVGGDETRWCVEAGFPTPLLARRSARCGFGGVHRLVGVPGTVGGGVVMNAGAHGQEFGRVVEEVEMVTPGGEVRTLPARAAPWRYRESGLPDGIVVRTTLTLEPADPAALAREIRQHFRWRKAGTPFDEPCCGSVFRNPSGAVPTAASPVSRPSAGKRQGGGAAEGPAGPRPTAGQLIEACGLKGFRIGGAEVSRKHANYIVNAGGATAADVRRVMDAVRERVDRAFGIVLVPEVKFVGDWGAGHGDA